MKIAYLASRLTLPGALNRREDALEHDQMMAALQPVFSNNGWTLEDIAWDDSSADWSAYDAALIGTTWDYCDRTEEFLDKLDVIQSQTPLFNPPNLVRWNFQKSYLRELAHNGVNIVPTYWLDNPASEVDWSKLFADFDTSKLVAKRQVGANAEGQFRLDKGQIAPAITHPMMIQPYLSAIASEGEYSFVFIDGQLSHSLIKRPASGDYRIQSSYGGVEEKVETSAQDKANARAVLDGLEEIPMYARVDMVRDQQGQLLLMELELIEPFLYPLQGPDLGDLLFQALSRRLIRN